VSGITIRNGKAPFGGGIANSGGSLTLSECVIENNQATVSGGGIVSGKTLKIIRSTIRSNTASSGGGLSTGFPSTTTVRDSTIQSNRAGEGGGISNRGSTYLVNSTVAQNTADGNGGGIYDFGTADSTILVTAGLYNTTVIDNDADHDRDETGGVGGGIYASHLARIRVVNSLIGRNTLGDSPVYSDCRGTLELSGYDVFGVSDDCTFTGISPPHLVGPGFGNEMDTMLRDNGGPTLTVAPLPGSVAIDNAVDCRDEQEVALTTDQRGAPRVAGAACDVGAVELGAVVP
jgi:predicted outer membrane repeat protein